MCWPLLLLLLLLCQFPLSAEQRSVLIQACEEFEKKPRLAEVYAAFKAALLPAMQRWIDASPGKRAFFKLSSTSSKDSVPDGGDAAEHLCARDAAAVLRQLATSFRVLEDLQVCRVVCGVCRVVWCGGVRDRGDRERGRLRVVGVVSLGMWALCASRCAPAWFRGGCSLLGCLDASISRLQLLSLP